MTPPTQNQLDIFNDRYALKNAKGAQVELHPKAMWFRVAEAISSNATDLLSYYKILMDFKFVPGGRILSGAGAEDGKTFYNCYVIPVETAARRWNRELHTVDPDELYDTYGWNVPYREDHGNDSREAIFDTIGTMVGIMSRGGGVGINWSVLRPKGTYLTRVSGTTSGPVSWMHVASTAVGVVEQGGTRRGAAMFMLDDWHPDIEEFIDAKRNNAVITNANISVAVSDRFMEAVRDGLDWSLRFPDTTHPAYDTEWAGNLYTWEQMGTHRTIPAQELWRRLTDAAHASGEPGVVFLERYNKLSTGARAERIICVNPCGEQGLGPYSVCNLGAMNLDAYVDGDFDWESFDADVRTAIHFLDDVIDRDRYYVPETELQQKALRRTGLGVMGLADALVRLGIRYGSDESVTFVEKVFQTMKDAAIEASMDIAAKKGPAGAWGDSMWSRPFLTEYAERHPDVERTALRNIFLLTQAPTGTTSLLAGVNSGIEPYFDIKTLRRDRTGERYVYAKAVQGLPLDNLPEYVVTSKDVTVEEHIAIQAAVQKYVDSSVSKTINAPRWQTLEETAKAYQLAYDSGLKGLAYYRDGSRDIQVLYSTQEEQVDPLSLRCPDCDGNLVFEEGCKKCYACGYAAC
jgi:ribonucleoside-diphosphate reductase alpha chain